MKKIGNEIVIYDIKKNTSKYQWKDLNCFYRVFAIALGSIDDKYFDAFVILISLYIGYIADDSSNICLNASDDVIRYYNSELGDMFGTKIMLQNYSSYRSYKKKLFDSISKNSAVIIPCDLYYLPYSKTYLEQHRRHYLLIKGINIDKNVVYVIDNMHIDLGSSTEYSDFIVDLDTVYRMNNSFCKIFDTSGNSYFWHILLSKNVNFINDFSKYISKAYIKVNEYNKNINRPQDYELQICFGRQQLEVKKYMKYVNTKIVLFSAIENMICSNQDAECLELCKKITLYKEEREKFKIPFVFSVDSGKSSESLKNKIIEFEKCELEMLNLYSKVIGRNSKVTDKKQNHIISNNRNARLNFTAEDIHIILDSNTVYDIWKNSNDGVMVYDKVEDSEGTFKTIIQCKCDIGSSCNFGIIVILENGCRLLFGSLGRFNIAVHKIDNSSNYELFIENHIIENYIMLEIKFTQENIVFFVDGKEVYSYCTTAIIKYCGVFAKTWEKCFCDVKYSIK